MQRMEVEFLHAALKIFTYFSETLNVSVIITQNCLQRRIVCRLGRLRVSAPSRLPILSGHGFEALFPSLSGFLSMTCDTTCVMIRHGFAFSVVNMCHLKEAVLILFSKTFSSSISTPSFEMLHVFCSTLFLDASTGLMLGVRGTEKSTEVSGKTSDFTYMIIVISILKHH